MIYSQACAYALRALAYLHLLQEESPEANELIRISDICERDTELPSPFVAKIFQQLAKQGWLKSTRGRMGGFNLAKPASEIHLVDIVTAIDGPKDCQVCISGLSHCSSEAPCPLHDSFMGIRESIISFLEKTTLADMSIALDEKIQWIESLQASVTTNLPDNVKKNISLS